jgi:hypothetical protein
LRFQPVGLTPDVGRLFVHEDTPEVVRFEAGPDVTLTVLSQSGESDALWQAGAGIVYANLSGSGALALEGPPGRAIVLLAEEAGLAVIECIRPLESEAARLVIPVEDWLEGTDAWLQARVRERRGLDDPWEDVACAGMLARLVQLDPAATRATVEAHLMGRPDPVLSRPRAWIRGHGTELARELEGLAVSRIEELLQVLEALDDPLEPSDPAWRRDLLLLCQGRDDLEGVRLLMEEAGAAGPLGSVVAALDRKAGPFVRSLPAHVGFDDEQIRRAAALDPEAWWASLAAREPSD